MNTKQRILACIKGNDDVSDLVVARRLGITVQQAKAGLMQLAESGKLSKFWMNGRWLFHKRSWIRRLASVHFAGYRSPEYRGFANW